ncbi:unnamed protein product [Caenorhabditis angaria]|uniref:Globin domain-containing protein n=1 Tax=Caenorhabditis angaria TaxID=860376 RepID=A0A9P1IH75_9PELO|nr:unnamed protein product [Caenorhabditis angaria]
MFSACTSIEEEENLNLNSRKNSERRGSMMDTMMGLLSTIRGKKDSSVGSGIGSAQVGPLNAKTKKLVIQEWPAVLAQSPDLFQEIWLKSATRSTSIKKAFGIGDNENPMQNASFLGLSATIQAYFYKLIITYELNDELVRESCEQLGARHVDFITRGFHSHFWDIFLVCMAEKIDETLSAYMPDEDKKNEMILAWQRVVNSIVHQMRAGYSDRRKQQIGGTKTPSV